MVPSAGMKLTNLRRLRGREWLWRNDQIPLTHPVPGSSYIDTADSGGWDECFPTIAPSPIPGAPAGTASLPDHGELWSAAWTSSVYDHDGGTTIAGTARGTLLPYEFHREVTIDAADPVVRLAYQLKHTGDAPFPWIWSAHSSFTVQPGTELTLPTVSQVKVDAVYGRDDLARNDVVSWPAGIGGRTAMFVFPEEERWATKLFGDIGSSGRMTLVDPRRGERLEITVSPDEVPQVGLWINCQGWAPDGRRPYYHLGLEPSIGAPDRLEDAVVHWQTAPTLMPGEERRWTVELRLPEE